VDESLNGEPIVADDETETKVSPGTGSLAALITYIVGLRPCRIMVLNS
jgi:hypothetical protein